MTTRCDVLTDGSPYFQMYVDQELQKHPNADEITALAKNARFGTVFDGHQQEFRLSVSGKTLRFCERHDETGYRISDWRKAYNIVNGLREILREIETDHQCAQPQGGRR